jgi:hypothetical protein
VRSDPNQHDGRISEFRMEPTAWMAGLLLSLCLASPASAATLPPNWPMSPSELEKRFASQPFRVLEFKDAGDGVTRPLRMKIEFPDGRSLDVKWKIVPPGEGGDLNNPPRKEIAAYEVQKWLFDENDYVVPTIALRCIPLDEYRRIDASAKPTFPGSSCVLGAVSVWMQEVTAPDPIYDAARFERDPLYARYFADLNLLGYLIEHRDSRPGNVLLSTAVGDPRVFLIDNGYAFDLLPWNVKVDNLFHFQIPWLRRQTIEKLRGLRESELEKLETVAQLELGTDGIYRPVPPGPRIGGENHGVRRKDRHVQFGLTEGEIEDLEERIETLLSRMDSGKQPVR